MDLATMAKKVQAGEYKGVEQLQTDFKLMISNCKKYNSQKSVDEEALHLARAVAARAADK